ncbi:hypothetical protein Scep_007225 [Stephania cephalantha]|uniref:Uncharacterized protein n=1 Tax=Stephania cephalantha TaxID=152367 RepID=A0AAP0K9D0_9MAGN
MIARLTPVLWQELKVFVITSVVLLRLSRSKLAQTPVVHVAQEVPIATLAALEEHATSTVHSRVELIVAVLIQADPVVVSRMSQAERQEEFGIIISTTKLNTARGSR